MEASDWVALLGLTALTVAFAGAAWRRNRIGGLIALPGVGLILIVWLFVLLRSQVLEALKAHPGTVVWEYADSGETSQLCAAAAVSLSGGALVASLVWKPLRTLDQAWARVLIYLEDHKGAKVALLCAAAALTICFAMIYGVASLMERHIYDPPRAVPSLAAASGLLPPAAFAISWTLTLVSKGGIRVAALAVIVIQVLMVMAMASRLLSLLPVFAVGLALLLGRRIRPVHFAMAIAAAAAASAFVLSARLAPVGEHGLVHYIAAPFSRGFTDVGSAIVGVAENIAFGVALTGFVGEYGRFEWSDLALSLSMDPASASEWEMRSPALRVHDFIPYNGLGELASVSPLLLFGFLALIAFVATSLQTALVRRGQSAAALLSMVLYLLAVVLMLQYNLRASSRFLLVVLAVMVGAVCVRFVRGERAVAGKDLRPRPSGELGVWPRKAPRQ